MPINESQGSGEVKADCGNWLRQRDRLGGGAVTPGGPLWALSRIFSSHGRSNMPCPSCDISDFNFTCGWMQIRLISGHFPEHLFIVVIL